MKFQLFLTNLPYNCSDSELQSWIESYGIQMRILTIIHPGILMIIHPPLGDPFSSL
jgi:hypothetical protein